mgnify:CR=1 FL=1
MTELTQAMMRLREASKGNKPEYKCPKCKDSYFVPYVKDGITYFRDCECAAKHNAIRLVRASGLNEADMNLSLSDYKVESASQKKVVDVVSDYMRVYRGIRLDTSNSMLLSGKPGKGKTMLAIITMNHLLRQGERVLYVSYRDKIMELKQRVLDREYYQEEMQRLKDIDYLILDDLFKGKITEADVNLVMELVNYRYQKRKPIIVSTEKSIDELNNIDEALGSRIVQMSRNHIVIFDESISNYRLK